MSEPAACEMTHTIPGPPLTMFCRSNAASLRALIDQCRRSCPGATDGIGSSMPLEGTAR